VATALLGQAGLSDARLDLRRAGDAPVDLNLLKNQLNQEVDKRLVQQLQVNDAKLTALEASVRDALAGQAEAQTKRPEVSASTLREEVHAQLPQVDAVTLAYGAKANDEATTKDDVAVVVIELTKSLKAQEKARLEQCLQVRLQRGELQLVEYLVARPKKTRG
jgi:hypothetical protein